MMLKRSFFFCPLFLFCVGTATLQAQNVVRHWEFAQANDRENWTSANHIKDVQVKDGIMKGFASGDDPFFIGEGFDFATTKSQGVEIRYRTNRQGNGDLYYTNTTVGPYGGFLPKKLVSWKVVGDEQWHTVRIFPNWDAEKKIIRMRIDFPHVSAEEFGKVYYEIDWIRVVDMNFQTAPRITPDWDFTKIKQGWKPIDQGLAEPNSDGWKIVGAIETDPMTLDVDDHGTWVSVRMAVDRGRFGRLTFFSDSGKAATIDFPLRSDGKDHWYNIAVDGLPHSAWSGKIHLLQLEISDDPKATATLKQIRVSDPSGPAELSVLQAYQPEAINRVGTPMPFSIRLKNEGGETVKNAKIEQIKLPSGLKVVSKGDWQTLPEIDPLETETYSFELLASTPVDGKIEMTLGIPDGPKTVLSAPVRFEKSLDLPKADYVPEPQPVQSDYNIGALYFPGWSQMERWEKIYSTHPERKPVLGWYDESNPEVIDWQIKWSVENGIQYYLVDWYWNKGNQYLDHWVKGFQKARYKSMFKWAMMWANHNGAGSHSEEDQRAVTKFWIENYFNTPEYLTRDGRPVVMIWSAAGMDNDVIDIEKKKGNTLKKGEGVKRLLDISQEMAREAGLKGIFFIAMKWPEASTHPDDIRWLADAGFEMTSIYHFMSHGGKAKNPLRFPFNLVVDASLPYMEARHKTGILPFLPNLSTGWDSRPWHGERQTIIEGRSVDGFRTICQDYKKFSERTGIRDIVLAPTNEWGEGSYAEPNAEFGFGMFETIRNTFCKKPNGGWPINYGPTDVGRGPYDLPPIVKENRTEWDFKTGPQGWRAMMGVKNFKAEQGTLAFETTTVDPAISISLPKLRAENWSRLIIRMKITGSGPDETSQLFWSTTTSEISEPNSLWVPVRIDGQFRDYVYDLKAAKTWRRMITGLRFDPLNSAEKKIEIESIRLE